MTGPLPILPSLSALHRAGLTRGPPEAAFLLLPLAGAASSSALRLVVVPMVLLLLVDFFVALARFTGASPGFCCFWAAQTDTKYALLHCPSKWGPARSAKSASFVTVV